MIEKTLACACAALLVLAGFFYVRMNWAVTDLAQYRADVATNTQRAEAEARKKEQALRRQTERITDEAAKKQTELADRAATADRAAASLRDQIDGLNAGSTPTDPEHAAAIGQARTARELLGACAARYRAMAQSADELRDQVSGLQDYATTVCAPSGQP